MNNEAWQNVNLNDQASGPKNSSHEDESGGPMISRLRSEAREAQENTRVAIQNYNIVNNQNIDLARQNLRLQEEIKVLKNLNDSLIDRLVDVRTGHT